MPFGVKKEPLTYQKVVNKTFTEYLNYFMKILLYDFTMYNDMENHLQKQLCFQKCIEYGISLNPKKCAFMVFLGMILGCIIFEERKLPDPKKI